MTNKECNTQNDHLVNFVIDFLTLKSEGNEKMIKLKLNNEVITLNTHQVGDVTLYKAQDLLKGIGFDKKKVSNTISNWKISMEEKGAILENQVSIKGGRNQGTYLTKTQILMLCGYVSHELEFAVYKAFSLLTEGQTQEASNIAGSLCVDLKVAEEVDQSWKAFGKWVHTIFKSVHPSYGSNFTKLVIKKSLGVSKTTNIRGKVDNGVVQKLIEQNHGDAILALRATIKLCSKFFNQKHIKELMKTYEGKMETYQMLSDFLTFE